MIENVQHIQDLDIQGVTTLEQTLRSLQEEITNRRESCLVDHELLESLQEYKMALENKEHEREEEKQQLMRDIEEAHLEKIEAEKELEQDREDRKNAFQVRLLLNDL